MLNSLGERGQSRELLEEISNDDIEEEFNPDSIPIFKLDLLDIEESLYAKQLLHYEKTFT